jgi:uncharacterized protein YcgI (DUF1989 family)
MVAQPPGSRIRCRAPMLLLVTLAACGTSDAIDLGCRASARHY